MLDIGSIRKDFPLLDKKINGKPIVYLDSTATSLKPQSVINKENEYYEKYSANIFRGIYQISEKATLEYESVRGKVARFIGASTSDEIIFTRNTTESINLVASSLSKHEMKKRDHIVVSIMEHHSNFVPWQQLGLINGWKLDFWKNNQQGLLNLKDLDKLITRRTKLLAITAVSNVLGTINPIGQIVKIVKKLNPGCLVLVDAAQAVPHMPVNVGEWGADFVAFSSHKMLGPTGVGVLWGKYELLEQMSPYQFGGEMIEEVRIDKTLFKKTPHKFEAGTPHIAGVIGFGAAIDYLSALGMDNVRDHEKEILSYALTQMKTISGLTLYGPSDVKQKSGVIAFTLKQAHAHDVAQILDEDNICIRSGNHCAMPLHISMGIAATARASFYVYTTKADVDIFVKGLEKVIRVFK
ncbi:MAG TPA: SufS family cysteine desulfurase [Patescibacteria group bacterium]|nr:SufS family cysteine desulfurase [Patescibacteria group bacterium]